jgi:hypothetical protein
MADNIIVYIPVRKDTYDGHEWPDVSSASRSQQMAKDNADDLNARIPQWATANPVIRIGKFIVTEEAQ